MPFFVLFDEHIFFVLGEFKNLMASVVLYLHGHSSHQAVVSLAMAKKTQLSEGIRKRDIS
jgi:hypothetical protein